jgi:hypothetical protein
MRQNTRTLYYLQVTISSLLAHDHAKLFHSPSLSRTLKGVDQLGAETAGARMDQVDVDETERWRVHDRQLQGLQTRRQRRAQAVVDVGESAKQLATFRGSNPVDDLLELYLRVASAGAKHMVADAVRYVRIETDLVKPFRCGGIAFDSFSHWPTGQVRP